MPSLKSRSRALLRRVGLIPPRPPRPASLVAADAARTERNWAAAAKHYRAYLTTAPSDGGVWVQLGHMLKESGRLTEADSAYAEASRLRPSDDDILLHHAHVLKRLGDYAGAARLHVRGAELRQEGRILRELAAPSMREHLSYRELRIVADAATNFLHRRISGASIRGVEGLAPYGGDGLEVHGQNGWVELKLDLQGHAVVECVVEAKPDVEGSDMSGGRLWFDFGKGFSHAYAAPLRRANDGSWRAYVVRPDRIRRLRWAPDQNHNHILLAGITFRGLADTEAQLRQVAACAPPELDIDRAVRQTRATLAAVEPDLIDLISAGRVLSGAAFERDEAYAEWIRRWDTPTEEDRRRMAEMAEALPLRPRFSFVMPVYNPPPDLLDACIRSLRAQIYPDFEICIADDASPDPRIRKLLKRHAAQDPRIRLALREANGHISAASNSALALATGDFIALVDHDDLVPDHALFTVARHINARPDAQILYSDEDKISLEGVRSSPYFKSDFNAFLMCGHNMVSHLGVYRRDLVEAVGGFRMGLEGSQDYDLFLRCYERIQPETVVHVPHVLYHWRTLPGSTAISADQKDYAFVAAQAALNGHFERTQAPLRSVDGFAPGVAGVKGVRELDTCVSIIIPTRDGLSDLKACVRSIERSRRGDVEILIVDNGSKRPATLAYLDKLRDEGRATVIRDDRPFNFSALNNLAARQARGEILCFLNNDTEALSRNWLDRARQMLAVPGVGVVGARLLYPDGALQHFGVVLGVGPHRVASHAHAGWPGEDPGYFGKAMLMAEFSAVTGACLFARKTDFLRLGGFDEKLAVAYNDVDLCLRFRQDGLKVVCDPMIVLIHKESRTRGHDKDGAKAERLAREARLMRRRWAGLLDADPYYSPNLSLDSVNFDLADPPRAPRPWDPARGSGETR